LPVGGCGPDCGCKIAVCGCTRLWFCPARGPRHRLGSCAKRTHITPIIANSIIVSRPRSLGGAGTPACLESRVPNVPTVPAA
jgi:hypothetical protein